jgi:uncharacterized protein YbjT (DUF2867 family)
VLIASLLQKGYTVHATVRSIASNKHAALLALPGSERLKFFEADLLKEGSFEGAFQGSCASTLEVLDVGSSLTYTR